MREFAHRVVRICLGGVLAASVLPTIAAAEGVPCHQVLAELNRRISRNMDRDPKRIAKSLGTEPVWVEECLRIHGRRVSGPRMEQPGEEPTPRAFDPNQLDDPFFPAD